MNLLKLMIILIAVAVIWGEVLPRWAASPEMRSALDRREAAGINSNATWYSDNPAALAGLETIQELSRSRPEMLWVALPAHSDSEH